MSKQASQHTKSMSQPAGQHARSMSQQASQHALIALVLSALVFLLSIAGITYASWQVNDMSNTQVSTTSLEVEVITDTTMYDPQYPGADITRAIQVKNTGEDEVFVRIKTEGFFRDAEGNEQADTQHLIQVAYDTTYWKDGSDGYYYLKGVLKPNAVSPSCISSITLSSAIDNKQAGQTALVVPQAEALQVPAHAVTAVWGKTYEFMEAAEREPKDKGQAHITFVSPTEGFVFIPTTKDLYPNAKNLTAGETVTHTVTFTNSYTEPTALTVGSGNFAPDEQAKLLSEYATLTITNQEGDILFTGPAAGSAWDAFSHTMTLASGASVNWQITLYMHENAPNDVQGLHTNILSWALSAQKPTEPPGPTPGPTPAPTPAPHPGGGGVTPDTGENHLALFCACTAFVSGVALIFFACKYRASRRESSHD